MKKGLLILLLLLGLLLAGTAAADTVSLEGKFKADSAAEYIDLGKVRITNMDALIKFMRQLPNIKKVDMFNSSVYPKDIDKLVEAFPDVEFGWTMRIGDHLVRTDATAFSTLHGQQDSPHTEQQFKYLKYCRNLQALDIGHNGVKDVSFLYDLPNLKVLILSCNKIQDITPVGSLTELQYLELFKNDISDISCLANCTNLLDLNICFNRITDWTPVYQLEKLERLWMYNSNNYSTDKPVSKEVVVDIKAALPSCYVDSTSYSTLGGWREHDRYDVVYQSFKYSTYIPFMPSSSQKAPN